MMAAVVGLVVVLALGVAAQAGVSVADVLPGEDASELDDGSGAADQMPAVVSATARLATVRIAGRNCDGLLIGSGFRLDAGLLTNNHLVPDAVTAKVDQPVLPVFADVTARSAGHDLALLEAVDAATLSLAVEDAVPGELVLMAGHGGGGPTQTVEGTVQLVVVGTAYGISGEVLLIDGRVGGGFSGGPVLNRNGEVIGVIKGYEPTLELTVAIPVSSVRLWLEEISEAAQPGGLPHSLEACDR